MKKVKMRHDNVRDPEQSERMRRLEKEVGCFFCDKNYLKVGASGAIHESKYWYIKRNDYPYAGTVHHYLIATRKHVTKVTQISPQVWSELLKMVKWLDKYLKIKGYSILGRTGDMRYTGATLDHLHFHFVSGGLKKKNGKLKDNVLVTLAHKSARRRRS